MPTWMYGNRLGRRRLERWSRGWVAVSARSTGVAVLLAVDAEMRVTSWCWHAHLMWDLEAFSLEDHRFTRAFGYPVVPEGQFPTTISVSGWTDGPRRCSCHRLYACRLAFGSGPPA